MTKNYRAEGESIEISGVSGTTVEAGSLYKRTGSGLSTNLYQRGWIGVVTDEIIGDDQDLTTIGGAPILIGDGVSAEAQKGTGKGDMFIEGVFTLRLPASGTFIYDADPLYAEFNSTTEVASGVTDNVGVATPYANFGPISGALVGFAVGGNYTGATAPFNGLNVVDVKLCALPLNGLAEIAPVQ